MPETIKPFTFLAEGLPAWKVDLDTIKKKIEAKQSEIAKVPVPVARVVKKTASTESIRPNDNNNNNNHQQQPQIASQQNGDVTASPTATTGAEQSPQSKSMREQQALLMKRKRKTGSVLSGRASGPLKYRTRSMIIVYYDSEVQKAFEDLVRNIGTGRNLLRKGKMAAKMEALAAMTGLDNDDEDADGLSPSVPMFRSTKMMMPSIRAMRARAGNGLMDTNANGPDSFDLADKSLEKAQNLCERGAHQFLRDGDCQSELEGCREHFEQVLIVVQKELEKRKKQDAVTKTTNGEGGHDEQEQKPEPVPLTPPSNIKSMDISPTSIISPDRMDIEVDDTSDNDIELDLSALRRPIRLTSRC